MSEQDKPKWLQMEVKPLEPVSDRLKDIQKVFEAERAKIEAEIKKREKELQELVESKKGTE